MIQLEQNQQRKPRTVSRDVHRKQLIVTTMDSISKRGFSGTTLKHHAIWSQSMKAAGPDPADQLTAVVEADFDKPVCSPKKPSVWFAFWGQAVYRPNYLKTHHKYDEDRLVDPTMPRSE